jgi:hypothetical protein
MGSESREMRLADGHVSLSSTPLIYCPSKTKLALAYRVAEKGEQRREFSWCFRSLSLVINALSRSLACSAAVWVFVMSDQTRHDPKFLTVKFILHSSLCRCFRPSARDIGTLTFHFISGGRGFLLGKINLFVVF